MKTKVMLVMATAILLGVFSCKKDEPKKKIETTQRELTVDAHDYSNWTYVNLRTGEMVTKKDFSDWNLCQVDMKTGKKTVLDTQKGEGSEADVKIDWHIAFHQNQMHTNSGTVMMTDKKELSAVKEFPTTGFQPDKEYVNSLMVKMDMKLMAQGKIWYASKAVVNPVFGNAFTKKGSMGNAKYIPSDYVFLLRCKDGSTAKLKFLDFLNAKGEKGYVKFAYEFSGK